MELTSRAGAATCQRGFSIAARHSREKPSNCQHANAPLPQGGYSLSFSHRNNTVQLMINLSNSAALVLAAILCPSFRIAAQTPSYVTVYFGVNSPSGASTNGVNYPVQTNQLVSLVGYDWATQPRVYGDLADGTRIFLTPSGNIYLPADYTPEGAAIPQIVTGLTNVNVTPVNSSGWATFKITTPGSTTVVSNYVPADAVVIPSSASGNAQIILESSPDLVNWTAANPGFYDAATATNRFFRVRAVLSQ
jgi:hypothetical protein